MNRLLANAAARYVYRAAGLRLGRCVGSSQGGGDLVGDGGAVLQTLRA
jgi:hypothetical protein